MFLSISISIMYRWYDIVPLLFVSVCPLSFLMFSILQWLHKCHSIDKLCISFLLKFPPQCRKCLKLSPTSNPYRTPVPYHFSSVSIKLGHCVRDCSKNDNNMPILKHFHGWPECVVIITAISWLAGWINGNATANNDNCNQSYPALHLISVVINAIRIIFSVW